MNEHPTKREMEEYCRRVLAPASFLSVHRHVIACSLCAAQCNSPADLARDLAQLNDALISAPDDTPYHLSAVEVLAYRRGELDEIDSEIVESHLGICNQCLSEVQRNASEGQSIPVASAALRRRPWLSLPWVNKWQPWQLAAVVAFVAALIFLALWLPRIRPAENQEQTTGPANLSIPQSSARTEVPGSETPRLLPNAAASNGAESKQDGLSNHEALVLNDGSGKVAIDRDGRLIGLELLPARMQQKVKAALQAGRLEQPAALAHLTGRPSALLSESGNGLPFRLLGPLGQVVRSDRPTFRWGALQGAQSYKVVVTDADLNEVATSPPLNKTQWRITQPLKPGEVYSWQVTALKDAVTVISPVLPAPQAKFKVIDRATSETLQQAEHAYPGSHLMLGVLYADAGLLDEAERELRLLVRNNPRAGLAYGLLRSVQAMRAARTSSSGRG
jgi:hypothetical protein